MLADSPKSNDCKQRRVLMGNFPLDSGDERDASSGHSNRTTDSDEAVGVVKLYRAGLFP